MSFILQIFLNLFFFLDFDTFLEFIKSFPYYDGFSMADPVDPSSSGTGNDDSDDEEIGQPGKLPPKPFYQNSVFQWSVAIACFIVLGGFVYAIAGGGAGPAQPNPNIPDANVRLAGGSSEAANSTNSTLGGGDNGGGGSD